MQLKPSHPHFVHAQSCACPHCSPREISARALLIATALTALPVYGLFWLIWSVLP